MSRSYGLNAYRSHDLNISMRTSSGDIIKMDFSNKKSASLQSIQDKNSSKTSMSFSSEQSFQFSINSNGISAQDKKEIDAFMKTAQPFIDKFLKELTTDAPKSPVTLLAKKIANIFNPNKNTTQNESNLLKTSIVNMFDKNLNKSSKNESSIDKIFKEMQNLLKRTMQEFDKLNKEIYA